MRDKSLERDADVAKDIIISLVNRIEDLESELEDKDNEIGRYLDKIYDLEEIIKDLSRDDDE